MSDRRTPDPSDRERLRRIEEILDRVASLAPADRVTYLDEACGDDATLRTAVERLLTPPRPEESDPEVSVGRSIGPYRLVECIGEGGMGEVWLADQTEPVRRRVALKVIKRGMDSRSIVARFEAERQALALMDHPYIAKIFDAGTTLGGRPYFVMEHIDGVPITEYCDRQRLTTHQRLELFRRVCDGVQHAHQKALIHRDLKPSNVLVAQRDGRPEPKIIDFGIAKATAQPLTAKTMFTELGVLIGTPEYMSPEQAGGQSPDIDTRTDVFSLGVILYEMLIGVPPFDASELRAAGLEAILRKIREEDPARPSARLATLPGEKSSESAHARRTSPRTLQREVSGDLDWIALKALEKERERRYDSPAALSADIACYLNDEPVNARPPSSSYRIGKFARRNRLLVTSALVVLVTLIVGLVGTSWGLLTANAARRAERRALDVALQRTDELEQVVEFQSGQLAGIDPALMGVRLRADLLERAGEAYERARLGTNETDRRRRELERLLAGADFTGLALKSLEVNILDRALDEIDARFEDQPLVRARLMQTIATTMVQLGLFKEALAPQREALRVRETVLGATSPDTLASLHRSAVLHHHLGRHEEAEEQYRRHHTAAVEVHGPESSQALRSMTNLGTLLMDDGDYEAAEELLVQAEEASRRALGEEHADTLAAIASLTALHLNRGRYEEAEELAAHLRDLRLRLDGEAAHETLLATRNLALALARQGRLDEAETILERVVEIREREFGIEHRATLLAMDFLAILYWQQGRLDEAEPLVATALEHRQRLYGPEHSDTLASMLTTGMLLNGLGRYQESRDVLETAAELRRRVSGADNPDTLHVLTSLGIAYKNLGLYEQALETAEAVVAGHRNTLGPEHPDTLEAMNNLGVAYRRSGRYEEAEQTLQEALELRAKVSGTEDAGTASVLHNLGNVKWNLKRYEDSERCYLRSLEINERARGPEHPKTLGVMSSLAWLYLEQQRLEEATELLTTTLAGQEKSLGPEHPSTLMTRFNIATLERDLGNLEASAALHDEVLSSRGRVLGDDHPDTVESVTALAAVRLRQRNWKEAERLLREAAAARERTLAPADWRIADTRSMLGEALVGLERLSEAEPMLLESFERLETSPQTPRQPDDRLAEACRRIVTLYDAWHAAGTDERPDGDAARWRVRLETLTSAASQR